MRIRNDLGPLRRRCYVIVVAIALALGLLHVRMAQLQIFERAEWQRLAENNRLRRVPIPASRGRIFDRRGRVLAENIPSWQLLVFPDEINNLDATISFLAEMAVVDVHELENLLAARSIGTMAPLVVAEDLTWEQVASIRVHQSDYPELSVISGFRRNYPAGRATAHAVGYLRRIGPDDPAPRQEIRPDRLVGAVGIEAFGEALLRGTANDGSSHPLQASSWE